MESNKKLHFNQHHVWLILGGHRWRSLTVSGTHKHKLDGRGVGVQTDCGPFATVHLFTG